MDNELALKIVWDKMTLIESQIINFQFQAKKGKTLSPAYPDFYQLGSTYYSIEALQEDSEKEIHRNKLSNLVMQYKSIFPHLVVPAKIIDELTDAVEKYRHNINSYQQDLKHGTLLNNDLNEFDNDTLYLRDMIEFYFKGISMLTDSPSVKKVEYDVREMDIFGRAFFLEAIREFSKKERLVRIFAHSDLWWWIIWNSFVI